MSAQITNPKSSKTKTTTPTATHHSTPCGYNQGGVDSHADLLLLGVLDSVNPVLADNISDAFIPGEAAGFLLLVSEQAKN